MAAWLKTKEELGSRGLASSLLIQCFQFSDVQNLQCKKLHRKFGKSLIVMIVDWFG